MVPFGRQFIGGADVLEQEERDPTETFPPHCVPHTDIMTSATTEKIFCSLVYLVKNDDHYTRSGEVSLLRFFPQFNRNKDPIPVCAINKGFGLFTEGLEWSGGQLPKTDLVFD